MLATTSRSSQVRRLLLLACAVGSVVLLLRGALGLILLGVSALDGAPDAPISAVLLAIEPYFVLGGLILRQWCRGVSACRRGGTAPVHAGTRVDGDGRERQPTGAHMTARSAAWV